MYRLTRATIPALVLAASCAMAQAGEVKIEHGGLTLNANLETTGEDWTSGPVVLMTHGTLAHGRMEIMATLQPLLMDRGISSLAITLGLGVDDRHGMYDCATPHKHRHADAVEEIGAWLAWLKAQGVEQVALLGHSRGGNQTAWFASEQDDPAITKVILVAPGGTTADKEASEYEKRFGTPLAPVLAEARRLVAEGKGDTWMENVGFVYCADARATASSFVAYHAPGPQFDTAAVTAGISRPVLIIAGTEDTVVPDVETSYAPLADKGTVTLSVIDGADHMFRDLYAEEVADAVDEFINE